MPDRFISIWFPHLVTDWLTVRRPALKSVALVLAAPEHGRMVTKAANLKAQLQGVVTGMGIADVRALISSPEVMDYQPGLEKKILHVIARWLIRYTPAVALDPPGGLILDVTGCAHLWGGEQEYFTEICTRLTNRGYLVRSALADTIGAAWGMARYGKGPFIIPSRTQATAILPLPPAALRVEAESVERLEKLGLRQVKDFIGLPRTALRKRFGAAFLSRIDQALGHEREVVAWTLPLSLYQGRLPCPEPISTVKGITIALQRLLDILCCRLTSEGKGLRAACFTGYRADGKSVNISISTNSPSHHVGHLLALFALRFPQFEPGPGIELFMLEAKKVENSLPVQEKLWTVHFGLHDPALSELADRLSTRFGAENLNRFMPAEHHLPEHSYRPAISLREEMTSEWRVARPRPIQLLARPEPIEVTAPIPDYPPMLFRYRGTLHTIKKADGPERIEQEWWMQEGQHRDYYCVENEEGQRFWLFRSGHYTADRTHGWFIHGFFA